MKREDFKQIIKLRSLWKIDKRKGDYVLPNGERLSTYIRKLVESQMELDKLAITSDGNLELIINDFRWYNTENYFAVEILVPFGENERCSFEEQNRRVTRLIFEIVQ